MEPLSNAQRLQILFFLFIALLLRMLYALDLPASPYFASPVLDALYYDNWAKRLAAGGWGQDGVLFRAPLFPYFLGVIYRVFGINYFFSRFVLLVLGGLGCGVTYAIGRRICGHGCGLIAAGVQAAYWPLIFYEGELVVVGLYTFLVSASLLFFMRAEGSAKPSRWLTAGLLLGLSAITRPNILLFAPLAAGWSWWAAGPGSFREGLRHRLNACIMVLIGFLFPILPVTLHNLRAGDFVLIASQGGINFFIGNQPGADGTTAKTAFRYWFQGEYQDSVERFARFRARQITGRPMKPSEVSRFWFRKGLGFWKEHPQAALRLLAKKAYLFWQTFELPNNKNIYVQRQFSRVLKLPLLSWAVIGPLGLAGALLGFFNLVRGWKIGRKLSTQRPKALVLLLLFLTVYFFSVIAFFVCDRYRIPTVPAMAVLTGYLVVNFIGAAKQRIRPGGLQPLVIRGSIAAAALVLLNINFFGFSKSPRDQDHWSIANAFQNAGDYRQAIENYERALAIRQDYPEALLNLGNTYYRLKRYTDALEYYESVLDIHPESVEALNNIAACYLAMENPESARVPAHRAVALRPDYPLGGRTLAEYYFKTGHPEKAAGLINRILGMYPDFGRAWLLLGNIHLESGNSGDFSIQRAGECFRRAMELLPEAAEPPYAMARFYAHTGQPESAIAMLKRAVEHGGRRFLDMAETDDLLGPLVSRIDSK